MKLFNSLSERNCPFEVDLFLWSTKMDLLALSSTKGDLFVQRLFWKKAWHKATPEESVKISGLCWSPCGLYLVIGHSNGQILICRVENGKVAHQLSPGSPSKVVWFSQKQPMGLTKYRCDHTILPPLKKLNGNGKDSDADNFFARLNLTDKPFESLLIYGDNWVQLNAYGFFQLFSTDNSRLGLPLNDKIIDATITEDVSRLLLCYRNDVGHSVAVVDTSLLQTEREAIVELSVRFNKLLSCCWYLTESIGSVKNSWEDILLDIDAKFAQYAKAKFLTGTGDTVGDDLLAHLAYGEMSAELEQFLLHDLTEKGLKKLGLCVENTYTTVQKLISTDVELISATLVSELAQLMRLCENSKLWWHGTFQKIGLSEDLVASAFRVARNFSFKVTEIQTVIAENLRNFKCFFRWLYNCIISASAQSENNPAAELKKFTSEDVDFVVKFIQDTFFHKWTKENPVMFKLERVGQYLNQEKLSYPYDCSNSAWANVKRLAQTDEDTIDDANLAQLSLISLHDHLILAVQVMMNNVSHCVSQSLKLCSNQPFVGVGGTEDVHLKSCYDETNGQFQVFAANRSEPNGQLHRYVIDPITGAFVAQSVGKYGKSPHSIVDFDLYTADTLALLLSKPPVDHHQKFFVSLQKLQPLCDNTLKKNNKQHPVLQTEEDWSENFDPSCYQEVSDCSAARICVSGTRKVGCILFASRNQLRLVEFEPEEETSSFSAQNSGLMEAMAS